MEFIDYTGQDSVADIIKKSKLCHFYIFRYGANKQTFPVFECLDTATCEQAAAVFLEWARITKNAVAYDMILTDKRGFSEQPEGQETKGNKAKQIRFSFRLKSDGSVLDGQRGSSFSAEEMAAKIEARLLQNSTENALMAKIKELEDRLNEEDEDEEDAPQDALGKFLGALQPHHIDRLMDRFMPSLSAQPTLSGTQDEDRLSIAISKLQKADPNLVEDLEKLVLISEKDPGMFKMVLTSLRNVK